MIKDGKIVATYSYDGIPLWGQPSIAIEQGSSWLYETCPNGLTIENVNKFFENWKLDQWFVDLFIYHILVNDHREIIGLNISKEEATRKKEENSKGYDEEFYKRNKNQL